MINESEWNRMISGELYTPWKVGGDSWAKVHVAQKAFNESEFRHDRTALNSLKECFGSAPIPGHYVAAGNPCKVIRRITEEDHEYRKKQCIKQAAQGRLLSFAVDAPPTEVA